MADLDFLDEVRSRLGNDKGWIGITTREAEAMLNEIDNLRVGLAKTEALRQELGEYVLRDRPIVLAVRAFRDQFYETPTTPAAIALFAAIDKAYPCKGCGEGGHTDLNDLCNICGAAING